MEIRVSWDKFVELRSGAIRVDLGEGYCLANGEMNPSIFIRMLNVVKQRGLVQEIWEQFASPESAARFRRLTFGSTVKLQSWGMTGDTHDAWGYYVRDSTMEWPMPSYPCGMGAVLMHPPYFGSSVMSENSVDLSALKDKEEYKRRLWAAFRMASKVLQVGGLVCAVGRRYRFGGEEVELDRWMLELAEAVGFEIEEVWSSCPDVVLVLRWGKK